MSQTHHPVIAEDVENIVHNLGKSVHNFSGKTVLITGGAGFLGKYLVWTLDYLNKYVLETPALVIVLDNFIVGLHGQITETSHIKIIKHDVSKPFEYDGPIDYILHAASIAAPMFYNRYRLETIDVGFIGTKNMLELAKKKGVKSFLFFSTSEIYGNPDPKYIPTPETYNGNVSCTGPRAAYDEPKRIGETLCMTYGNMYNMPIKIVRPFNVFGPGMRLDDGRGAINFVVSALRGKNLPVYGDGRNTRTWTYITDAITGFFQVLLSNHNLEVFNVGSDEQEIEMRYFAQIIVSLVQHEDADIEHTKSNNDAYDKADPNRRCPDLTKIRTMIGFVPRVSLINGLRRFIPWVEYAISQEQACTGEQSACRICENKKLREVISFGNVPLANNLAEKDSLGSELQFPLTLQFCPRCKFCQLSYIVSPQKMFDHYLYLTSTTQTFRKHFQDMAVHVKNTLKLKPASLVVDVGSNDGLLLKHLQKLGMRTIGVDPAENICQIARENGVDTIYGYFNKRVVDEIKHIKGAADLVTSNNVFAHVGNIKDFTENVKDLLKDTGVFVIEVQYLLDTLNDLTFDNIYHEHVSYYSVHSITNFFKRMGMNVFRVEHVDTHGGSIRVFAQKKTGPYKIDASVDKFMKKEKRVGIDKFVTYKQFANKIYILREKIHAFTKKAKSEGKRIIGYGAPAKATTLLNFFKINHEHIDYIVEDNDLKVGKYIPGVHIPIVNKDILRTDTPDYVYILAWNFADEIIKNNKALAKKSKFIVLGPTARLD